MMELDKVYLAPVEASYEYDGLQITYERKNGNWNECSFWYCLSAARSGIK